VIRGLLALALVLLGRAEAGTNRQADVEGSYVPLFLTWRSGSKRRPLAGKALCFSQRMGLNGALSNPFAIDKDLLIKLYECRRKLLVDARGGAA
jgi:hypothetical protein